MRGLVLALLGGWLAAGLAQAQAPANDVALSWERGTAHVPGKFLSTTPAGVATDKPYPVVLYLHGCVGISAVDWHWARFLKDQGYIVIQPESLKRDRPASCEGWRGGLFPGVYRMRLEELGYAREQIGKASWADKERIYLMGHSEGGITVSLSTRDDFRAAVISAWHCGTTGIRVPASVPLLAIDHQSDPWFPNEAGGGCAAKFGERQNAKTLTLPGAGHGTFEGPAPETVAAFFRQPTQ
jgi:dienelactone hydrolase